MTTTVDFHKERKGDVYFMDFQGVGTFREPDFTSLVVSYVGRLGNYDREVEVRTSAHSGDLSGRTPPYVSLSSGEKTLVSKIAELHNLRFKNS